VNRSLTTWHRPLIRLLSSNAQRFHALRRLEIKALESLLAPRKGESILDVGCGKGFFCRRLRQIGVRPWGVDPQIASLDLAKRQHSVGLSLQAGVGESLPYRDRSFKKAVSVCVLEHTTDDDAVLREVHRVLEPGGTFVCSVDALNSPLLDDDYKREHACRFRCNRFYTEDSLRSKLSTAGFEVSAVKGMFASLPSQWVLKLGTRLGFGPAFIAMFPLVYPLLAADRAFGGRPGEEFILVASARRPLSRVSTATETQPSTE
jgi:SAM-dependent methyltransferase